MRPSEQWENIAEIIRAIEPALEAKLRFCRNHPPDPATKPVTSAVVALYISRLELALSSIRGGAPRLREDAIKYPESSEEMEEIESWIIRKKPGVPRRKLTEQDWEVFGNWFVSKMGYSYSETKHILARLRALRSGKGAPSKHPETLKMMDARIAHGWTYRMIASKMCDCGLPRHTAHCEDRIRQRLKELRAFLKKYGISPTP